MNAHYMQTEIEFLTKNYSQFGPKKCSEVLHRSYNSVKRQAKKLHLKMNYTLPNGYSKCYKCKRILSRENFNVSESGVSQSFCKLCQVEYKKRYRENLKSDPINRLLHNMMKNSRSRAKELGLSFDLTKDFLRRQLGNHCPVFNLPYYLGNGKQGGKTHPLTPSLDRFDNTKGYTQDNVFIISWRANAVKSNASIEELESVLNYMKRL